MVNDVIFDILKKTDNLHFSLEMLAYVKKK